MSMRASMRLRWQRDMAVRTTELVDLNRYDETFRLTGR